MTKLDVRVTLTACHCGRTDNLNMVVRPPVCPDCFDALGFNVRQTPKVHMQDVRQTLDTPVCHCCATDLDRARADWTMTHDWNDVTCTCCLLKKGCD